MSIKLDVICAGHISQIQTKECIECKNDNSNNECTNYHPIGLYIVKIPEIIRDIQYLKKKKA